MPHQCVRCNNFYDDNSPAIIKGCSCGARLFFYIKKEKFEKLRNQTSLSTLTQTQRIQIEKDVLDIVGQQGEDPVILDLETIRVNKPGNYELDLVSLFNKEPVVIKLADGKYMIDVVGTFDLLRKKKE